MAHIVHVDICKKQCSVSSATIEQYVKTLLETKYFATSTPLSFLTPHTAYLVDISGDEFLVATTNYVRICEIVNPYDNKTGVSILIHLFQYSTEDIAELSIEDDDDSVTSSQVWSLPSKEFDGLWESLLFEEDVKTKLQRHINTMLLFSSLHVDPTIVAFNRMILLHGPPGTGKTTLSRALAHKVSIRFYKRFEKCKLIEINAHSLFSKWFSESGKLVLKVFDFIKGYVRQTNYLVFVLIDEVESLSAAREAAMNGNEPSDAIRVVNAILTQIDGLCRCENVVIITTTNLTKAIDRAFLDRADLSIHVGLPSERARYEIIRSSVMMLMDKGLITRTNVLQYEFAENTYLLKKIAFQTQGMSGRAMRKLAFQAYNTFCGDDVDQVLERPSLSDFVTSMSQFIVDNSVPN